MSILREEVKISTLHRKTARDEAFALNAGDSLRTVFKFNAESPSFSRKLAGPHLSPSEGIDWLESVTQRNSKTPKYATGDSGEIHLLRSRSPSGTLRASALSVSLVR